MSQEKIPLIQCQFKTTSSLYLAYMPFLTGGGVFLRSNDLQLSHGEVVHLSVGLPDDAESYSVEAKVVWTTPRDAQENKPAGFGFQFSGDNARHFRNKIETCLAGMLKSVNSTDTM